MVSGGRRGSVTFWAWMASIAAHLIMLTVLGVIEFSGSVALSRQQPIPTAKVSRVERLIRAAPVIPKPKVKKASIERFAKSTVRLVSMSRIFDDARPGSQSPGNFAKPSAPTNTVYATAVNLPYRVKFFGSSASQRKVCYLVDCSGSMQGIFGRVRGELKASIGDLQPDQYFYIIFFGGDRLFEFGVGRLIRASQKNKSAAYNFIDSIRPAGRTNALPAFERALQVRDRQGASPSIVYFLTDGFELTAEDEQKFPERIVNLQRRFAPGTKINTIGFWPESGDRKMLEVIARRSGGDFVFVGDGNR